MIYPDIGFLNLENIQLLPEEDQIYLNSYQNPFTINNWSFFDFILRDKNYVSICQRNYPVMDVRLEWLYDTTNGKYVLSKRGYNEDLSVSSIIQEVTTILMVIQEIGN